MTTRFTFKPLLLLFLLLVSVLFLVMVGIMLINRKSNPPFGAYIFIVLFLFVFIWILFGEFRRKVARITLEVDTLNWRGYWGLGRSRSFYLSDFDVAFVSRYKTRFSEYEYLYLVRGDKREIILSEFYHQNYAEMKSAIILQVKNVQKKKYSIIEEISKMFT